jgi:hypothetical protein
VFASLGARSSGSSVLLLSARCKLLIAALPEMMQFLSLMKTQVLNKARSKSPTPGGAVKPPTAQLATVLNRSIMKLYGTHLKEVISSFFGADDDV